MSEQFQFLVQLMHLLRCGKVKISDTNMDIYIAVMESWEREEQKKQKKI